jgi:hypothetical protein
MKTNQVKSNVANVEEAVRGRAKSGRVWKCENKKFSNMLIQKSNRTNWDEKIKQKSEKKLLKQREIDLKNERKQKGIVCLLPLN